MWLLLLLLLSSSSSLLCDCNRIQSQFLDICADIHGAAIRHIFETFSSKCSEESPPLFVLTLDNPLT